MAGSSVTPPLPPDPRIRTALRDVTSPAPAKDGGAAAAPGRAAEPRGGPLRETPARGSNGGRATRTPEGPSDESLMLGLVGRDVGALGALYDRYSTLVYSVSLRVLADRGLAEDVVQEVFLQLWRRPASYDAARGRFVSWLMSVTRNRAIDEQRRRSRRMRLEDPDEGASEQIRAEGRTSDPQLEAVLAEERLAVRAAMDELPPEQRRMLQLAYFGGLTQTEIARYTGEPLGTVKTRVRLGMQKLRLSLSGTWQARRGGNEKDERTGREGS